MGDLSEHFNRSEFACRDGCGRNTMDYETILVLEDVRNHFGKPVKVNSGHRCAAHNKAVGGASSSQHLYGRAADISISGITPSQIADYVNKKFPQKYGIGTYKTFAHIDTRSGGAVRWKG